MNASIIQNFNTANCSLFTGVPILACDFHFLTHPCGRLWVGQFSNMAKFPFGESNPHPFFHPSQC